MLVVARIDHHAMLDEYHAKGGSFGFAPELPVERFASNDRSQPIQTLFIVQLLPERSSQAGVFR